MSGDRVTAGGRSYVVCNGAEDEPGTFKDRALLRASPYQLVPGIDVVDVVGLATDHCVRATALGAKALGFAVRVLSPLVAGVAPDSSARALNDMRAAGIAVV